MSAVLFLNGNLIPKLLLLLFFFFFFIKFDPEYIRGCLLARLLNVCQH